jgi:AraC-like DNA-binding protein
MYKVDHHADASLPQELRTVLINEFNDPTAVGDSMEVLNYDVVNLASGPFRIKRTSIPLKDCCLVHVSTSVGLRTRTTLHDDFEGLFIAGPRANGTVDGIKIGPFNILAASSGVSSEVIVDQDYESIALMIPTGAISRQLDARGLLSGFNMTGAIQLLHPNARVAKQLFELGKRIVAEAENNPEKFNDNAWVRYGAQVEYLDFLLAAIETCVPGDDLQNDRKGKSYSQIVKICEEFTLGLEGRRPYLGELCNAANVSKKTLHNAYLEIMGMPPIAYLNRLRLHRARNDLRRSASRPTTVTAVAMRWGFWHFGEFSQAYKKIFGELPSATLKR